jgi:peptidoglycan/xylan/chitin deacetylase (PgdA/CDA1 family)
VAKALAIKVLAAFGVFAALWFAAAPLSWIIAGTIAACALALLLWGVFDVNSSLWAPTFWRARGSNSIALTFDDGPDPNFTPRVLEILAREKVPAAFFVVGERAAAVPALVRAIASAGHIVGNHSHTHAWNINFAWHARLRHEVAACSEAIKSAIGKMPAFYRAPFGFKNPALGDVLQDAGLVCIGWQLRGFDAVGGSAESIARRLVLKAKAGGVLLLHDGAGLQGTSDRSATLEALPMIIEGLRARGFEFKRLDDLLEKRAYL